MSAIQASGFVVVVAVAESGPIQVSGLAVVSMVRLFKYIPPKPVVKLPCQAYTLPIYKKVI